LRVWVYSGGGHFFIWEIVVIIGGLGDLEFEKILCQCWVYVQLDWPSLVLKQLVLYIIQLRWKTSHIQFGCRVKYCFLLIGNRGLIIRWT
jgi:hypothetical protein